MTKKLSSLLLVIVLAFAITGYAQTETIGANRNTIGIRLNNLYIEAENFVLDGTTYVPIRTISEYFGDKVDFDSTSMTADIDTTTKLTSTAKTIDYVVSTNDITQDMDVEKNAVTINIDGKKLESDNYLFEGTTYIPLRAVANALNCTVNYDQATKSARIYTSDFLGFSGDEAVYYNGEKLSKDDFTDLVKFVYNGQLDAGKADGYKAVVDFLLSTLSAQEILKKLNIELTPEEVADFGKQNNADALIKQLGIKNEKLFSDTILKYFTFTSKAQAGALEAKMLETYVPTDEELILEYVKSPYSQGDWMKAKHILIAKDETGEGLKQAQALLAQIKSTPVVKDANATITDTQLRTAYDSSPYSKGLWLKAKHILIPKDDKGEGLKKAKDLIAKIKSRANFDKLMLENSTDPGSKAQPEGYLFKEGDMVKEFYDAALKLKDNEVSGVVETQFGYHIIKKVTSYRNGVPFAVVKDSLKMELTAPPLETDFDKLMQQYSTDPGSKAQPDGYIFKEGDMVAEFYKGAKDLKENEVSDIVESQFGYHIIKKVANYTGGVPFQILKPDLLKATAMNALQKDFLNQRLTKDVAINGKIIIEAETPVAGTETDIQGAQTDAK
jgi:hypothetical protein